MKSSSCQALLRGETVTPEDCSPSQFFSSSTMKDTCPAWAVLCASPTSQRSQSILSWNEPTRIKSQLLEKQLLRDIFREVDEPRR